MVSDTKSWVLGGNHDFQRISRFSIDFRFFEHFAQTFGIAPRRLAPGPQRGRGAHCVSNLDAILTRRDDYDGVAQQLGRPGVREAPTTNLAKKCET